MNDEQRQNFKRSNTAAAVRCIALTSKVLSDLQVCLGSVELLQGMTLPAEAYPPLRRLSRALDDLVAAAAEARRPPGAIEDRIPVGSRAERS